MQTEDEHVPGQPTYEMLVYDAAFSFQKIYAENPDNTEEFNQCVSKILDKQKGFMDIDAHGHIRIIDPAKAISNKLIGHGKFPGYFITKEGRMGIVQLPTTRTVMKRQHVTAVDNKCVNDVLAESGLETLNHYALHRLSGHSIKTRFTGINDELDPRWLYEEIRVHYRPNMEFINKFDACREEPGFTGIIDTKRYADRIQEPEHRKDAHAILEENMLEQIVRAYNSDILFRVILSERIAKFSRNSDAVKIAMELIRHVPFKSHSTWLERNITKSMREENLDKEQVLRIVTSINRPKFERMPGNKDKDTFDQIRIHLGLVGKQTISSRNEILRRNQKTLAEIAIAKIKDSKSFQRYGIPVNFLKLDHMTITQQDELELLFVLKDISS